MNILDHVLQLNGVDQAVMIAGYLLANSADNLSYIDEVKVLTPFTICLKNGQFHPKFYTGNSQAESIAAAKQELTANKSKYDAWALAREGTLDVTGHSIHTISVSAWAIGMQEPIVFIQRFARVPRFRLIDVPIVGLEGSIVGIEQSKPMLSVLLKGVSLHEDGGLKWGSWH